MLVSFQLTMPNVGSWNGKWTGSDRKYYVVKKISDRYMKSKEHFKALLEKRKDYWHYSWNDGWGANVTAEIIDGTEARKRRKETVGFAGYEWMIDSILYYGSIMNTNEMKQYLQSQKQPA
jgi:hypothetical protein